MALDMLKSLLLVGGLLLLGILFNIIALVQHAKAEPGYRHHRVHHHYSARRHHVRHHRRYAKRVHRTRHHVARVRGGESGQIVAHPAGCPRTSFCGCGVAIEVFGRSIRDLWLAANWLRFPRAEPAPGMVAARSGHVFVIREVRGPGLVLAYDPNSGGHRTRIHLRRLAGFTVVNPHAGSKRFAELTQ